MLMRCLD